MAFTTYISTSRQVVDHDENGQEITVQLLLGFSNTSASSSTDLYWDAKTVGIRVSDWGVLEYSYDFQDLLLTVGKYSFTLDDALFTLRDLLFKHTGIEATYTRTPRVEIRINDVTEFIGFVMEDSIKYDQANRRVKMSADPNSRILNQIILYNPVLVSATNSQGATDPLGYGHGTFVPILSIIEKIYQKVNRRLSINEGIAVSQDWVFTASPHPQGFGQPDDITDGAFNELRIWIDDLFWDPSLGYTKLADVLRALAVNFGCFTGLLHNQRAFFRKLFVYNAGTAQTLGKVLKRVFGYEYALKDYVEITGRGGVIFTRGSMTDIEDRMLKLNILTQFWSYQGILPFFGRPDYEWSNTRIIRSDVPYYVYAAFDPVIDVIYGFSSRPIGDVVANWWYHFRSDVNRCRVDTINVVGITYDFEKNFSDEGRKYQIVSMKKFLAKNETEFEALYLGEV